MTDLKIVMAQINPVVGDIDGNAQRIVRAIDDARAQHDAKVVIFPELALTGYPPEDLLLRPSLEIRVSRALAAIATHTQDLYAVIGYPRRTEAGLFNAAGVFHNGELVAEYHKQNLPNYRVFDEKRYFSAGDNACLFDIDGVPVALGICEDIWTEAPVCQARDAGARLMLVLNASPFHIDKQSEREALLAARARQGDMPICYVNLTGAQDELVFDGGSIAVDADGSLRARCVADAEVLQPLSVHWDGQRCRLAEAELAPLRGRLESVYQTLVTGVRDYVNKSGFRGVVLGLSGGIDSALTMAIAVDALGAERVEAVMMPFRYTSAMSLEDAELQANTQGVSYKTIPIEPIYEAFVGALSEEFAGAAVDKTEENIQSRTRGVLLMAISNKKGSLVLTTGNKSEMAVGYSTLYGDMAGGFDVLKDVFKTLVFDLARYRNSVSPVIPQRVIDRPPSAELAPDQEDQDSLPPYDILDEILARYIEHDDSAEAIIAQGFERDTVQRVIRMVDLNEYKRRQAPIGTRITQRGFGRDRRYPIVNAWPTGD